jgi:ribosomal subunit interface protein
MTMHIQVNHDNHIDGSRALNDHVEEVLTQSLSRFGSSITRVEAHLSDENGEKTGQGMDKKCLLEARVAHKKPVVVSAHADSIHQAVDSAVEKLEKSLDSLVDKSVSRVKLQESFLAASAAEE